MKQVFYIIYSMLHILALKIKKRYNKLNGRNFVRFGYINIWNFCFAYNSKPKLLENIMQICYSNSVIVNKSMFVAINKTDVKILPLIR